MVAQKENPTVRANKLLLNGDPGDRKLNLTIGVDSWLQSNALHETTNFPSRSLKNQLSPLPTTPSTGRTFGGQVVAMQPVFQPRSPSVERERLTRRLRRYSQAEDALRASTAGLSETSPQELQIRILKQAAAVLNAHAEEARQNSARLRTLLLDAQLDPNECESLKRQRWIEERRQLTAEQESKALHDELELLSNRPLATTSLPLFSIAERRQANLIKFLGTSSTRRPLQVRPPHKRRSHRFTVSDLATSRLQLPQSIIEYLQTRARTKSLGGQQRLSPVSSPPGIRDSVAMTFGLPRTVTEPEESGSTSPSASPTTPFGFSPLSETPVTVPDTATYSDSPRTSRKGSQEFDTLEGRATIYNRYSLIRRKDEIIADMSHVTLPRYAKDLIHDFEDEAFNVSPRLRSTSSRRPSVSRSDTSDWELLSSASSKKMDDLIPSPSSRTYIQVSGDSPSLPPMYRKGHRPAQSIDKPLPSHPESPTKPTVLQKRPTHRPVLSLVAIPEASSSYSNREDDISGGPGLKRNLSLGMFHHTRRALDPEVTKTTRLDPDRRLPATPSSHATLAEQDEENEQPVQSPDKTQKSLRRKLSIAGLFSRATSPSVDSLDSTQDAPAPATVQRGLSLKEKVKRRLHLSKR